MEAPKVLPVVEPDNVKAKEHHPHLPKVGVGVPGGGALLLMISPVKTGKCLYELSKVKVKRHNKVDIINICDVKKGDYVLDKSGYVEIFKEKYNVDIKDMAFVGDDYFDLSIFQVLDITFCPNDAPEIIKNHAKYTLSKNGGQGVLVELYDFCVNMGLQDASPEEVSELDKREICSKEMS